MNDVWETSKGGEGSENTTFFNWLLLLFCLKPQFWRKVAEQYFHQRESGGVA